MKIKDLMIYKWQMTDEDWMGYKICKDDFFTFHHLIIPKRAGGPAEEWNGAILGRKTGHDYIHTIEYKDKDMFEYITNMLIEINNQKYMPTPDQLKRIYSALESFEKEYCGVRNSKGKLIIKDEYVERRRLIK